MSSNIDATKPVAGNALTANVRSNFQAAKDEINGLHRGTLDAVTAAGTVDAITATYTNAPTLTEGTVVVMKATGANTSTTPTLNVNALGAKTIVKHSGTALTAGDIAGSRHYCEFRYDATNTVWVLMNPAVVASEAFPVGSIYTNAGVSTNPSTLLGYGTWTAFGAGKVLVGLDSGDTSFDTLEETGGSKDAINVAHTHTASTNTTGSHTHVIDSGSGTSASGTHNTRAPTNQSNLNTGSSGNHSHTVTVDSAGSSGTNANLQPYITVYMWKRTA